MQYINQIMVVLDRNNNDMRALKRGLWLARSMNAKISILTNVWDSYSADNSTLDAKTREQLQSGLKTQAQTWVESFIHDDAKDLDIHIDVRWQKHLFEAVIEATNEQTFDLVMKAPSEHTLRDRIFTPLDWNLLRSCPAPVMMVKSTTDWQDNRLLACIDATSSDEGHKRINDNILSLAEKLSDHFHTDLHIVNAYPLVNVAFAMVPEVTAPDDLHQYVQNQHEVASNQWAQKYNVNHQQVHVREGAPEIVVSELAEKIAADLVVIGSIGRTGLSGMLIGNTAELLLDKLTCDILVMKPEDGVK